MSVLAFLLLAIIVAFFILRKKSDNKKIEKYKDLVRRSYQDDPDAQYELGWWFQMRIMDFHSNERTGLGFSNTKERAAICYALAESHPTKPHFLAKNALDSFSNDRDADLRETANLARQLATAGDRETVLNMVLEKVTDKSWGR